MSTTEDGGGALGSDLKLYDFSLGADLELNKTGDLEIASNSMNLAQAILHRLRTVKGELADLGHPDYGSTIFDFIGQPNNWVTRERLRLAIRDTIRQERRVKELKRIAVRPRLESVAVGGPKMTNANEGIRLETGRFSSLIVEKELENESQPPPSDDPQPQQYYPFPGADLQNSVDIEIIIVPAGSTTPVKISFPLNLEVG
jgi:phage baseplate assembly protein W